MNLLDPETVYAPLFTLLQGIGGFATSSRAVELLDDMEDGQLPALFMAVGDTETTWPNYAQDKNVLEAKVFLYAANDGNTAADIVVNGLVKALRTALVSPVGFDMPPALEGVVSWCRVEGKTEVFSNVRSTRAAAIVPVKLLVP